MRTFNEVFDRTPAITANAPGRVNLLGEHTDYNDGLVLPTALAQHTTVALAENGLDRHRAYSAELDRLCEFDLATPPAEHFATYVYGCLHEYAAGFGPLPLLDMHIQSSVPMGAGLSSSAALEVAILRALRELAPSGLDDVGLALMAQRAEINYAGVQCGILDQMAASLAHEHSMLFLDTRSLERNVLPMPGDTALLVVHSGVERSLAGSGYNTRRDECRQAARLLGVDSLRDATLHAAMQLPAPYRQRVRHVITENERVVCAAAGVAGAEFGELMNASHASLRDDYEVSVLAVDELVRLLQANASVYGAKITGGGFGGACVALCKQNSTQQVAADVLNAYRATGHAGRVLVS